jgi:hypothetical protein
MRWGCVRDARTRVGHEATPAGVGVGVGVVTGVGVGVGIVVGGAELGLGARIVPVGEALDGEDVGVEAGGCGVQATSVEASRATTTCMRRPRALRTWVRSSRWLDHGRGRAARISVDTKG